MPTAFRRSQSEAQRDVGLLALLDFLLGSSIDDVAARCRMSRATTEDTLRRMLLDYGFDARQLDE